MELIIFRLETSITQILLSGAAHVTNNRESSGESARPDGGCGTAMEPAIFLLAVSRHNTLLAVAQAMGEG
jgi:hypothetical protein